MLISKRDVDAAGKNMATHLGITYNPDGDMCQPFGIVIHMIFSAAYIANWFPPEREILLQAFYLCKEKGHYYDVE